MPFPFEVIFPQVIEMRVTSRPASTWSCSPAAPTPKVAAVVPSAASASRQPAPDTLPEEFRSMLGSVTNAKSVPSLKAFQVEAGSTVLALGASASIGEAMGLPVKNHLVEKGPDGKEVPLPTDKFYIPGSVLETYFNNTNPSPSACRARATCSSTAARSSRASPVRR